MYAGTSISVKQVGHAILTVQVPKGKPEQYLITLPRLRIEGLWYGSPYIELTETTHIVGSTGWVAMVCPLPSILPPISNVFPLSYFVTSSPDRSAAQIRRKRLLQRQSPLLRRNPYAPSLVLQGSIRHRRHVGRHVAPQVQGEERRGRQGAGVLLCTEQRGGRGGEGAGGCVWG
jgi:hypothetical protein